MAEEKITVSLNEVYSVDVDQRLKQQEFIARAAPQATTPDTPTQSQLPVVSGSWFRSSVVYLPVFGLVAGLIAWLGSEVVWQAFPQTATEFALCRRAVLKLDQMRKEGELSATDAGQQMQSIIDAHKHNPIVLAVWFSDPGASSFQREQRIASELNHALRVEWIKSLAWFTLVGGVVGVGLSIAEPVVGRNVRSATIFGSLGCAMGTGGGFFVDKMAGPVAREYVGYADGQCIPISRRATHEDWSSEDYSTLRWFGCPRGYDRDRGRGGRPRFGEGAGEDPALL